ncbi:MBL fold metallo-hydrolase [Erysipelothrix sp. HDW6C]|uniref:MBL fold metallo-hydrolase n=1 Tax=Erysipelothrix sp. HDW6C TaxID=2714930 RepID=UPI00140B1458|nr:MBL fold metallo-hydrolase [Erysipelothrix sp. HDW6C]QIK70537.1 MBL fold metallo-hydrolase [Erysipelothrix sp. HDW6C]
MELKDRKTKITFHSGVLTIGGTVIEVSYGLDRIFFDFGTEFKPELNLSNETLQELLDNRLIPELDHVYDPRLGYKEKGENTHSNTAVFLSHCHLDHTRMVNYLDPAIPMYALKETKVLLESLNANNDFILPLQDTANGFTREIIGLDNEAVVRVGDISVEVQRVDHDAYGACGLIINTPDMKIAYTGDLRLHGFDREDSLKYCEKAKGCDALIIEGVSISFDDERHVNRINSEQELLDKILSIIENNSNKQVTFNTYPANVKRLAKLVELSPRPVVLEGAYANILKQCLDINTRYYQDDDNDYGLDESLRVAYKDLLEDEGHYVWQVVDNHKKLKGGGVYIHSDATPLGEFDPAYQPFLDALAANNIVFERVACSGHAFPEDLEEIVDRIAPKLLLPIHSLHPERLENKHGLRHLPIRGETI